MKRIAVFAVAALASAAGCVVGPDAAPDAGSPDYYPLTVGSWWEYDAITQSGQHFAEHYEITGTETVEFGYGLGERDVLLREKTDDFYGPKVVELIEDDGGRAVRLRRLLYDESDIPVEQRDDVPGYLKFDRGRTEVGEEWVENGEVYLGVPEGDAGLTTAYTYMFEVLTPDTIEVPAGTFDCLVIKRTDIGNTGELKIYYFAPGVGKVKEITGSVVEELTAYSIAAP